MATHPSIIVIGGGAAGFFAALAAKKAHPDASVTIVERTAQLLAKVRISGGGRCNVTHACFDPKELVKNYPRGSRELLGPFHHFGPEETVRWFKKRGVRLKTERDGRMFPISNSSEQIIDCFLQEAGRLGVNIETQQKITSVTKEGEQFVIEGNFPTKRCNRLILATGSSRHGHEWAIHFGHTIQPTVPSLFTFNVPDFPLVDLAGAATEATLSIGGTKLTQTGPCLITHWGFSGPAALKLSAWGARLLHEKNYDVPLLINWSVHGSQESVREHLLATKASHPTQQVGTVPLFPIPKKLWRRLVERSSIAPETLFRSCKDRQLNRLVEVLTRDTYVVEGKTTNKEEFVTCGGVTLSEVDWKTMESRCCSGLYFAGEILDVDGITGGFNFQNAWTTGYLAGTAVKD